MDKYTMDTRHLVYELPGIYDTIISFPVSIMDGTAMLQIRNNTVFYSLHLSGLYSPLTAYRAVVSPIKCSYKIKPGQCHPRRLQSCCHPDKMWLLSQARSVSPSPPTELSSPRKSAATKSSQVSVTLTAYRAVVSSVKSSYKIQPGQCHPHRLQSCRLPDKMWLQSQARSVTLTACRAGTSPLKCSNKAKPGQCLSHSVH